MSTVITEVIQIETQALGLADQAKAIQVVDQPSYDKAVDVRVACKDMIADIDRVFGPMKQKAFEAHREICSQEKKIKSPIDAALVAVNAGISRFTAEQERIRREAEARAYQEAEERARREAEDGRLRLAQEAKNNGATDEHVDEILEAPVVVTKVEPVAVESTFQKSSSVVIRENWIGECFDLKALIKAAAKNPMLAGLLCVNQQGLNAMARTMKETMQVPGCKATNRSVVSTGRGGY